MEELRSDEILPKQDPKDQNLRHLASCDEKNQTRKQLLRIYILACPTATWSMCPQHTCLSHLHYFGLEMLI